MKVANKEYVDDGLKRMSVKEFRAKGYLQELNRKLLHPLGIALEVIIDSKTKEESLGGILDYRDSSYGIVFGIKCNSQKARNVERERVEKAGVRKEKFGWVVQPTETIVSKEQCE